MFVPVLVSTDSTHNICRKTIAPYLTGYVGLWCVIVSLLQLKKEKESSKFFTKINGNELVTFFSSGLNTKKVFCIPFAQTQKKKRRWQTVIKIFTPFPPKEKFFYAGNHFSSPVHEFKHKSISSSNATKTQLACFIVSRIISQGHQAPLCNLNLLTYQNVCIPWFIFKLKFLIITLGIDRLQGKPSNWNSIRTLVFIHYNLQKMWAKEEQKPIILK